MATLEQLQQTARVESEALGSSVAGAEHLFLAWLVAGSGAAHDLAVNSGVTAESFRKQIAGRRSAPVESKDGWSTHAQRALQAGAEAAQAAGRAADDHDVILALLREPRGAIASALGRAKVRPTDLKRAMQGGSAPASTSTGRAPRQPKQNPRVAARRSSQDDEDVIPEPKAPERPRLAAPPKPTPQPTGRSWSPVWFLSVAAPLAGVLAWSGAEPQWVFLASCVGIIPMAAMLATATEHLADRTGPMVGALLNATFGNATELIVAVAALNAGYLDLVKASITGSILSNLLLILGLALFAGGLRQHVLKFNRTAAGMSASMLALAVAALLLPTFARTTANAAHTAALSLTVASILAATYAASLLFTLRTHRQLFVVPCNSQLGGAKPWSVGVAIAVLAVATVVVALLSELLVHSIVPVTERFGLSQSFIGLILIPIVGNAAEHATAVLAARKGKMELAMQIALGSGTQVALLVAPLLVAVGLILGRPMDLVFAPFQVGALAIGVVVAAFITLDGESHWLEGLQLLALYGMIAAVAWFV